MSQQHHFWQQHEREIRVEIQCPLYQISDIQEAFSIDEYVKY